MTTKNFLRTTPFLLLAVFALIALIYELVFDLSSAEGWRYLWINGLVLLLVFLILVDVGLKYYTISRFWLIWVIELLLCLCLIYYWIIS